MIPPGQEPNYPKIEMRAFGNLLCNHLAGGNPVPAYARLDVEDALLIPPTDFSEVRGQEHVERAS